MFNLLLNREYNKFTINQFFTFPFLDKKFVRRNKSCTASLKHATLLTAPSIFLLGKHLEFKQDKIIEITATHFFP